MIRQAQRSRANRRGDDDSSESEEEGSEDDDDEAPTYSSRLRQRERDFLDLPSFRVQIRVARHVLLLLSRRQFSLLVYLMNFVNAVLHPNGDSDEERGDRTSNGVGLHDVARRFGGIILGGKDWKRRGSIKRTKAEVEVLNDNDRDRTTKEQKIMTWLVNHWGRIASAYEAEDYTPNNTDERSRARAASLPVNTNSPAARPRMSSFVPPRTQTVHGAAEGKDHRRPSECGSLTSGSTVSSSELEEIPIVSSRKIQPAQEANFKKPRGEYRADSDIANAPPGDDVDDEHILDYYCSSGSDGAFESYQPQEVTNDPGSDDDASIYSCGELRT